MTDKTNLAKPPSTSANIAGAIFTVALSLLVSLPLVAVGAAVAWRLFCMIAGVYSM